MKALDDVTICATLERLRRTETNHPRYRMTKIICFTGELGWYREVISFAPIVMGRSLFFCVLVPICVCDTIIS